MNTIVKFALLPIVAAVLAACARNEAAEAPAAPPPVAAAKVVSKPITEFDEFTGRFEAVERVDIRPRVSGYIVSANFQQGHEVKKGDILYVIDPRPYQATLNRAQAEVARAKTQLALAQSERERATKLIEKRAISQEEFDARTSGNEQASANLAAAEAARICCARSVIYAGARTDLGRRRQGGDHLGQSRRRRPDAVDHRGVHRPHLRLFRRR